LRETRRTYEIYHHNISEFPFPATRDQNDAFDVGKSFLQRIKFGDEDGKENGFQNGTLPARE